MENKSYFKNGFRYYPINKVPYVSVTSVLKLLNKGKLLEAYSINQVIDVFKKAGKVTPDILLKAATAPKTNLNKHAEKGTEAHNLIEDYLTKEIYIKNKYLDEFIKFREKNPFQLYESEKLVYSDKYKVAGKLDLLGDINGQLHLIDLKKSAHVYLSHKLQISAYKFLLNLSCVASILPLGNTKNYYILTDKEYQIYLHIFLHLVKCFYLLQEAGELENLV